MNHEAWDARPLIVRYLAIQGFAVLGWWVFLWLKPSAIRWFQPIAWPDEVLLSFVGPDVAFAVVGSWVAAMATWRRKPWAGALMWVLAGAFGYATLFCVTSSFLSGEAWLATSLMVMMSGLTCVAAMMFGTHRDPRLFRKQNVAPTTAASWTLFQTIVFWSVFLWIFPKGIVELMARLGVPGQFPANPFLGTSLFLAAAGLGLSSAWAMSTRGRGTPLPTSTPGELVVSGPYRYIRNPMALAGILQGIAVGWIMGNFWVIGYALLGSVVWHVLARPSEEQFLLEEFGESYAHYRRRVGLWLPWLFRGSDSENE